jgi:sugar transferase (PEP-CTERM/EpsH1 system associated)
MPTQLDTIVHLVPSFGCGGLERVVVNLIKHSDAYAVEHIVIAIENDLTMKSELPEHVKVYCLEKLPGLNFSAHGRLYRLLKEINPKAFHTYNFGAIEYHAVAFLAGVPIRVHADHGLGGDDPSGRSFKHNIFRRGISTLIHHYVVVSDDLKNWVIDTVKVNPARVGVVWNGIAVPECSPNKRKSYSEAEPFLFLTVGRLAEVKNQQGLIEAFTLAKQKDPHFDAELHLVGDGPLMPELQAQREASLAKSAIFLHGLQFDIAQRLATADAFVLSSHYEAMPMTVLEAMAATRPVICPKVGGVADFIRPEEALLLESNSVMLLSEAMLTLYHMSYEERDELANAGHLAVQTRYDMSRMVDSYMERYRISA